MQNEKARNIFFWWTINQNSHKDEICTFTSFRMENSWTVTITTQHPETQEMEAFSLDVW